MEFTCVDTDIPLYKDRVYLTAVDELVLEPHGQKIAVVLGPSKETISINSINYVQVHLIILRLETEPDRYLRKFCTLFPFKTSSTAMRSKKRRHSRQRTRASLANM